MVTITTRTDLEAYVSDHFGGWIDTAAKQDGVPYQTIKDRIVNALLVDCPMWGTDWEGYLEEEYPEVCADVLGGEASDYRQS